MDSPSTQPTTRLDPVAQIATWLAILVGNDPATVFEIRALGCSTPDYRKPHTRGGFFDATHLEAAAAAIVDLSQRSRASSVYFTLSPLNRDLIARRGNRVDVQRQGEAAADADVIRRRWLLIDCDPIRPAGISSTDSEKEAARKTAIEVAKELQSRGWPDPIFANSGNGWHLLYRIDLPADDGGIVQRCLHALAARFTSESVDIDKSVFNPARICKAYGCVSRKGDSTEERPHRRSSIKRIPPEGLQIVSHDLLRILASEAPKPKESPRSPRHPGRSPPTIADRVAKYIATCRPSVAGEHGHDNAYRVACELVRGFGLSVDDAMPFFAQWNLTCQPAWSDRELLRKLEEADRKADGEPGYLLRGNAVQSENGSDRINGDGLTFDLSGLDLSSALQGSTVTHSVPPANQWVNPQVDGRWQKKIRKV